MIWDILAGIFMGTLTGMGIGGGGLLVLYLTAIDGIGQLEAQGCNLLFFVYASAAALFIHSRKRTLDFRLIGWAALLAVIGSRIGVAITGVLPEEAVRHMFGWMLVIAGAFAGVRVIFGEERHHS
ncbi:MAG: sulfite exporter TauE/SafE family protein [Ruminococcaceae bacterium]|nr:sulfite exporter TauE/SafE family protein [Oscillospiraceae bacterium]